MGLGMMTRAIPIALVLLAAVQRVACGASADSPAFPLDTRLPGIAGAGVSRAFSIDTRQIYKTVRDGISASFTLDTRSTPVPIIEDPLPEPEKPVPPTLGSTYFQVWVPDGLGGGAYQQATTLDTAKPLYVIVHGWDPSQCTLKAKSNEEGDWMAAMAVSLCSTAPGATVLRWNWTADAGGCLPPTSRVAKQGKNLADLLIAADGANLPSIHFIGHSLGAGVVTYAAKRFVEEASIQPDMSIRVSLLDPPEKNHWAAWLSGLPGDSSGPLNLQDEIAFLAANYVSVDNYTSEVGMNYAHAENFWLKNAADVGVLGISTPGMIADHGFAPWWFVHSIDSSGSSVDALYHLNDYFFYFHTPGDQSVFWAGVNTAGFNFEFTRSVSGTPVTYPTKLSWTWYTLFDPPLLDPFAWLSGARQNTDSYPLLTRTENAELLNAATAMPFCQRTGYYPYLFTQYAPSGASVNGVSATGSGSSNTVLLTDDFDAPELWSAEGQAQVQSWCMTLDAAPQTYVYRSMTLPANAEKLQFTYQFTAGAATDTLSCFINDAPLCTLECGSLSPESETPWLDIHAWAGQTVRITFLLSSVPSEDGHATQAVIRHLVVAEEVEDPLNADDDNDGATNFEEDLAGTLPGNPDTDGDTMSDGWEISHAMDPLDPGDAALDYDEDGLTNQDEFGHTTNPYNADTDGDTWSDGDEVQAGTDPLDPDAHPPSLVSVPNVVGQTQSAAGTLIIGANLVLGTVTEQYHDTVLAGIVISQTPTAGQQVTHASVVSLVVSLGPRPITGSIVINGNKTATNSTAATLALTWSGGAGTGVSRMRFSNDGSTWSPWESLVATRAYALPGGDGYKTVRVQYLDRANNRSAIYNDYIRLDTVCPTGGILINNGAATTTSRSVTLKLNWADTGSGVTRMRFSDNGMTWTPWVSQKATRAYTLPAGLGNHTVRVQYTDAAQNYSPVCSDYIKFVTP